MPNEEIKIGEKERSIWTKIYKFAEDESDDIHTKIGCCLEVPPMGFVSPLYIYTANKFPAGVKIKKTRLARPTKYHYMEHAERRCTIAARKLDATELAKSTIYCPYFTCADCARAIIMTGIKTVAYHWEAVEIIKETSWSKSLEAAYNMFYECNIKLISHIGKIGNNIKATFNEKKWSP